MKCRLVLALFTCALHQLIAQDNVGIGVAVPNPHALMELFANDKGLLIPRLTDAERLAIPASSTEAGLLVYGRTDNLFYYWNTTQWIPFPVSAAPSSYNLTFQFDSLTGLLSITDGGGTLSTIITGTGGSDYWSRNTSTGVLFPTAITDRIAIGSNSANTSAILDVQSTTMGMLIPRMTTAQRLAITTPATGLKVFDTDAGVELFFNGTRWLETGADPIGTINAFHKSFSGTPALPWGWVECNGQVLNDAGSPYNGNTLPNLNATYAAEAGVTSAAGLFLRGSSTSGSISNDQTNTALDFAYQANNNSCCGTYPVPVDGTYSQAIRYEGNPDQNHGFKMRNRGVETYPGNMTVVWIIRVK